MRVVHGFSSLTSRVAVLALCIVSTAAAAHATFTTGDVAVATASGVPGSEFLNGELRLFTSAGVPVGVMPTTGVPFSTVFDAGQRLWFSTWSGDSSPTASTEVWATQTSRDSLMPFGGSSAVFDAAGNLYVLTDWLTAPPSSLRKYSPAGSLLATYALAGRGPVNIDLASDQCTMHVFYVSGTPGIGRYDVCTGTELTDVPIDPDAFADTFSHVRQFRVLADGSLLVPFGSHVARIQSNGTVLQTYTVPSAAPGTEYAAVALDPTGSRFWLATREQVPRLFLIDLASGLVLSGPTGIGQPVEAVAVAGERRAALLLAPAPIPMLSSVVLLTLATALLLIAIYRLG